MNPRLSSHFGCAVRNGLIATCLFSLLSGACAAPAAGPAAPTQAASASAQPPAGEVLLRVTVSGGIAGKSSTWTVHGDGRVESDSGVKRQRTSAQVAALRNGLKSAGFFDLADSYGSRQCRDCFVYDITVIDGSKIKTVRITDDGKLPAPVGEALAQINTVLAE